MDLATAAVIVGALVAIVVGLYITRRFPSRHTSNPVNNLLLLVAVGIVVYMLLQKLGYLPTVQELTSDYLVPILLLLGIIAVMIYMQWRSTNPHSFGEVKQAAVSHLDQHHAAELNRTTSQDPLAKHVDEDIMIGDFPVRHTHFLVHTNQTGAPKRLQTVNCITLDISRCIENPERREVERLFGKEAPSAGISPEQIETVGQQYPSIQTEGGQQPPTNAPQT